MKCRPFCTRILAIICIVAMLPSFGPITALAQEEPFVGQVIWTDEKITGSTVIAQNTVIMQELRLPEGATLFVDSSAELVITEDAAVIGNIEVRGEHAVLVNDGLVQGDILVTGAYAQVLHSGTTTGTLRVEGTKYRKNHGDPSGFVRIHCEESSSIQTLTLNGVGDMVGSGHIGTLNLESQNVLGFATRGKTQIDTAQCAGEGDFIFFGGARVETMYVQRKQPRTARLQHVYDGGHVETLYLLSGDLYVHQGASLGTGYVWGGYLSVNQGFQHATDLPGQTTEFSTAKKIVLRGRNTFLQNGGFIETLVAFDSNIDTFGRIQNVALYNTTINLFHEGFMDYRTEPSGTGFINMLDGDTSAFVSYLYAENSRIELRTDEVYPVWVDSVHLNNSRVKSDGVIASLLAENGSRVDVDEALIAQYTVAEKRTLVHTETIPCDEMATLTVSLASEEASYVLVTEPDGTVHAASSAGEPANLTIECVQAGNYTVRHIDLSGRASLQIEKYAPVHIDCALSMRPAVLPGEKAYDMPARLADYDMELVNQTRGTAMPVTVRENVLYAPADSAGPGDSLRLTFTHKAGLADPHGVDIQLDAYRMAQVDTVIAQRGYYTATTAGEGFPLVYLFDGDGNLMDTVAGEGNQYTTTSLAEGKYTALYIRGNMGQFRLLSLDDYPAYGLAEKKDYYVDHFTIKAGRILARQDVKVPPAPSAESPWLIAGETGYTAQVKAAMPDSLILMVLRFAASEEGAQPVAAEIDLGPGVIPVLESVSMGSQVVEAAFNGRTLSIPLTGEAGEIRFFMKADGQRQEVSSAARLVLEVEGASIRQYIGSATTKITQMSIGGPNVTADGTLNVYGFAAPYEEIAVYAGDVLVGTAFSAKDGMWGANIRVPDMRTGDTALLTSVLYDGMDGRLASSPHEIKMLSTAPKLSNFTMYYIEHGTTKKIDLSAERCGISPLTYAYEPGTDFTFILALENDEYVETMNVVGIADGRRGEIQAYHDKARGEWVACGIFDDDPYFVPTNITVEYALSEGAYVESAVMSTPFSELIALDTDLVDGDIRLLRFYSADARSFSRVGLFGQGWVSNVELAARVTKIDGTEYVTLFYQGLWRIFEKQGNGYREITDYQGTLTGSASKGFTLRETDGSGLKTDKNLRLQAVLDTNGQATECVYEGDRLMELRAPSGRILRFEYDGAQIVGAYTDSQSAHFVYEGMGLRFATSQWGTTSYDYASEAEGLAKNSLSSIRRPEGTESQFAFDQEGHLTWTAQGGGAYGIEYLYEGDTVTVWDALGISQVYTFDTDGQVVRYVNEQGQAVDYAYDEYGRITRIGLPDGTAAHYAYDGKNVLLTNALGQTTRYTVDDKGRVTEVVDPLGGVTKYRFDTAGNLTGITHPDKSKEEYAYNGNGQPTSYTDRMGQRTRYTYNQKGQLQEVTLPDRSKEFYSYHENGLLSGVTYGDQSTFLDYDVNDHLRGVGFPDQPYLWAERDVRGLLLSLGRDDVLHAQYTYNAQGQITALEDASGSLIAGYEYDSNGNLALQLNANGTSVRYTYEANQPVRIETLSPEGDVLAFRGYTYDIMGRVSRMETEAGDWQYAYDALGQLIAETAPDGMRTEYAYDALGSRTSVTVDGIVTVYQPNAMGQYERIGDVAYTYDKNGRVTGMAGPEGETAIAYDAHGRMASLTAPGMEYAFAYDAFGARTAVTYNGKTMRSLQSPFGMSQMLLAWEELAVQEGAEEPLEAPVEPIAFYWGPLLAAQDQQGQRYAYGLDRQGSTMSLTDPLAQPAGEDIYNPFGFVGGYGVQNDGNGLYYMRARMYWEPMGGFLTPDPVGQRASLQPYAYAANAPTLYIDPTGETHIAVGAIIGAAQGLGGRFIADVAVSVTTGSWQLSPAAVYGAAGLGGMAGGAVFAGTGNAVLAGAVGGGVESLLDQYFVQGERDLGKILGNTAQDAIGGALGGRGNSTKAGKKAIEKQLKDFWDNVAEDAWKRYLYDLVDFISRGTIDPSGYVYEAVASNRISGVTTTVYYRDEEGRTALWNAGDYSQENPLTTDREGLYAWYVPEGDWLVVYEKEGYVTERSDWLPVPPPQTEVHQAMVSYQPPTVQNALHYGDAVEITLDKYLQMQSVQAEAFSLLMPDGTEVAFALVALNEEEAWDGSGPVASRFALRLNKGTKEELTLRIGDGLLSYSGVRMLPYEAQLPRRHRVAALFVQEQVEAEEASTMEITVQIQATGGFEHMELSCEADMPDFVDIVGISPVDAQGRVIITLQTLRAGKVRLFIEEKSTGMTVICDLAIERALEDAA